MVRGRPRRPRRPEPRLVESESVRVLRRRGDLVISETRHGFVCANAGVDLSNVERGLGGAAPRGLRPLGPAHPRRPASPPRVAVGGRRVRHLRAALAQGRRPTWPSAVAGLAAVVDLRGTADAMGRDARGDRGLRGRRAGRRRRARHGKGRRGARGGGAGRRPRLVPPGLGGRRDPPSLRPKISSADLFAAPAAATRRSAVGRDALRTSRAPPRSLAELGPRLPAEVDARPLGVEGAALELAGPGRAWKSTRGSTPARSPMTRASSFTEISLAGPDVEHEAAAAVGGTDEGVDDVVDVDEVAGLLAVAEDGHRLAAEQACRRRSPPRRPRRGGPGAARRRWPAPGRRTRGSAAPGRRRDSRWPPSSTRRRARGAGGGATPSTRERRTGRGSP